MPGPMIELIPLRRAVRSDGPTTLDVLVRVTPPTPEVHFVRPAINLGLVLDRSGSMAGASKMGHAREAAAFAVGQLLPTDRVSVTVFDHEVRTIAANAPAVDKPGLVRAIRGVEPRGSTALHAGWSEGARQVGDHLVADGLNRVILLSDGLANQGLTDPTAIALDARKLAARGVGTTTLGLGDDYNEDLMQAMGESGDGNYYYVESPAQLADIFRAELRGLMATAGHRVSLAVEPLGGASVAEVLNDLDRDGEGRLKLPNLAVGMPTSVVARLRVPALAGEAEVVRVRLGWDDPKGGGRRSAEASLRIFAVPTPDWESLPTAPEVAEQVAILMAARAKKEAVAAFDRGDLATTQACVTEARAFMLASPPSPASAQELEAIGQIEADLEGGEGAKFRKRTLWQAFRRRRGQDS